MFKVMVNLHMNNEYRKFINTFNTLAEANGGIHDLFVADAVRSIFKDKYTGKPYDVVLDHIDEYHIDIIRCDTDEILGNINIIEVTENEIEDSYEVGECRCEFCNGDDYECGCYPVESNMTPMNIIPMNEQLSGVVANACGFVEYEAPKKELKRIIHHVAKHGYVHGFNDGFHAGVQHGLGIEKAIITDCVSSIK